MAKTEAELGCKLVYILREMRSVLEAQALERMEQRLQELDEQAAGRSNSNGGHAGQSNGNGRPLIIEHARLPH
jgi:hypothetical protein